MAPHKVSPPATPPATPGTVANTTIEPSLPREDCCISYWHKTTRSFPHLNANATTSLPTTSKYVIIGSGIAGALTAFSLLENGIPGSDVLILEAREAVSGASGRNAGHVRPDAFRGFTGYSNLHGSEQALKIIANEKLVFEKIDEFVKKHNVPCDFNPTTTFDVCLTEDFAKYEADSFQAYVSAGGQTDHISFYSGSEARQRTRVPDAVAAYEWPAGSSHPAKLAQWLLSSVIANGVHLFTHAPVASITKTTSPSPPWRITTTSRGSTLATTIIHCTNAYSAALLPQLHGFITPNKAQAHSLIPTPSLSGSSTLPSTMSLRYSMHHFYSLIQRTPDGTLILGVSRANPTLSAVTKAQIVSFDDSSYNAEIVDDALVQFGEMFPEYKRDGQRHGEGLDHAWTGIIGMTPDSVPLVGAVEGCEGQWICAGFNGHGMARIWTCAPGVARLICGGTWEETGLPECFRYSEERLRRAREKSGKGSVW